MKDPIITASPNDQIITTTPIEPPSQIDMCDGEGWVIRIGQKGIIFNHDKFPEWKPNDFCLEFIRILEECCKVKIFPKEGSLFKEGKIHQ